jgi:carboxymethylenebutenolidase
MAKHVDYYLSLNSPWAFLASRRFEAIAAKHKADVTIWPVDFGSVFAVSGGAPLPKRAPQRQAYRMMELKRWRDHLGVKTTLEPKFFPANEVPAAKCVIALREQGRMADAIKLAHAVLAALWAEEKNTGDPVTLQAIIAGCGLDAAAVVKASEAPGVAEKREAYTKQAIERGVFGAPSFVIDGEIFWGQDRLDFVDRKLAAQ